MQTKKVVFDLPIFSGFYESLFSYDYDMWRDDYPDIDNMEIDHKGYELEVSETVTNIISDKLREIGLIQEPLRFMALRSPKQYNYSTDQIEAEANLDLSILREYLLKHADQFGKYLVANHSTCDGYWSFVETDINKWIGASDITDTNHGFFVEVLFDFAIRNSLGADEDPVIWLYYGVEPCAIACNYLPVKS